MSMELYVACSVETLPSAEQLQLAASQNGVRLVVTAIDWASQSGFLPMVLEGRETGVEVDVWKGDDAVDAVSPFGVTSATAVVVMRWGSDLSECACALAFAGAVATVMKGRMCDPHEGGEITPEKAFEEAKSAIGMLD